MPEELGVNELAKYMKKSPATVRGLLRDSKVKKSGKSYSFANKAAMQSAAKKLGGESAPVSKKKKAAA